MRRASEVVSVVVTQCSVVTFPSARRRWSVNCFRRNNGRVSAVTTVGEELPRAVPELERGITARLLRPLTEQFAQRLPVRTVAVVGNAPLEADADRAAAIDGADLVIRANSFLLDRPGGEPVVGRVVNVCLLAYVTNITPDVFRDYHNRLYLVPEVGQANRVGDRPPPGLMMSWPPDLGAIRVPNDGLGLPSIQAMKAGGERRPAVPTTGTLATALARLLFPEARLLVSGFSFVARQRQKTWRHRYGTEVKVHWAHLLDREAHLMKRWVHDSGGRFLP